VRCLKMHDARDCACRHEMGCVMRAVVATSLLQAGWRGSTVTWALTAMIVGPGRVSSMAQPGEPAMCCFTHRCLKWIWMQ
jgi:hypothetical protein